MTEKEKTSEIARVKKRLATLREQIDNANNEARIQIEKRDKLDEQFKKTHIEIQELKNERDNLNEKVKTLKQQREEARAKIRAIIEEVKTYIHRIKELKKKTPRRSHLELQKEVENIEWKIQTTPFDMQEEKRLVENVKQLEVQLSIYKKIDQNIKKLSELRKELESLEATADTAHQELTEIAERSQEIHAKMMTKISESKSIKAKADGLHCAYVQAKENSKPLFEEFKMLTKQRQKLQDALREADKKRKKSAEEALRERIGSQARDKLQRGKKLSWEEFKLLAENGAGDN